MPRMDTNAPKTPATLPFAAWQAMSPDQAAQEVHRRIDALPENLRHAALAWVRPPRDLAAGLAAAKKGAQPLRGIPYLLKDLYDLAGVPTKAGSTFLHLVRGRPVRDGALSRRLDELGAACAGKTHLVEFAAGLFGDQQPAIRQEGNRPGRIEGGDFPCFEGFCGRCRAVARIDAGRQRGRRKRNCKHCCKNGGCFHAVVPCRSVSLRDRPGRRRSKGTCLFLSVM